MKKKRYLKRTLKLLCFALAVVLLTGLLQQFVLKRLDHNTMRMDGFYLEDSDSLDVVVIGASDVYSGFSPAYAYEKYGYTSYPYATQSAPANATLSQLKEVISYQHPKMILLEINSFLYKDSEKPSEANIRNFVDNIPWDEVKKEYIQTYVADDQKLEYYLPIIKFHSSWSDYPWRLKYLTSNIEMRLRGYSLFRGYKTTANLFVPNRVTFNDKLAGDSSTAPLGLRGEYCLRETLQYLQDNDIQNVVFVRFPHIVYGKSYSRFQRCNTAAEIIGSYGYDFINLERYGLEEGFDIEHDFYNWDHLNIYGSEKLTDYLSDKLINEYGLTPLAQTDEQKAEWQESTAYYHKIYDYCDAEIQSRLKNGNKGKAPVISEESKSMAEIEKYAENHPDA